MGKVVGGHYPRMQVILCEVTIFSEFTLEMKKVCGLWRKKTNVCAFLSMHPCFEIQIDRIGSLILYKKRFLLRKN